MTSSTKKLTDEQQLQRLQKYAAEQKGDAGGYFKHPPSLRLADRMIKHVQEVKVGSILLPDWDSLVKGGLAGPLLTLAQTMNSALGKRPVSSSLPTSNPAPTAQHAHAASAARRAETACGHPHALNKRRPTTRAAPSPTRCRDSWCAQRPTCTAGQKAAGSPTSRRPNYARTQPQH